MAEPVQTKQSKSDEQAKQRRACSVFVQVVCEILPDCMTSLPRRQFTSQPEPCGPHLQERCVAVSGNTTASHFAELWSGLQRLVTEWTATLRFLFRGWSLRTPAGTPQSLIPQGGFSLLYRLSVTLLNLAESKTDSVIWWSEFLSTDSEVRVRFSAQPYFMRSSGTGSGFTETRG
jgi:hypothetical protein